MVIGMHVPATVIGRVELRFSVARWRRSGLTGPAMQVRAKRRAFVRCFGATATGPDSRCYSAHNTDQ